MRSAQDLFVAATLVLAHVLSTECGRPRPINSNSLSAGAEGPYSSSASFALLSESQLQQPLPQEAVSEMAALRSALRQYVSRVSSEGTTLRSDQDAANRGNSLVQSKNGDMPFQMQESSGLQELTRSNEGEVPAASFEGYKHYPDSGEYKAADENSRSTENTNLVKAAPEGKLKDVDPSQPTDKDLKSCDAGGEKQKTPTTVHQLTECLKEAYEYFSQTVTSRRKDSLKQNEVDSQALNLMFDQMFDLSNMKRSLDAFQADEKKVSTTLLEQTKELRTKINTLLVRGAVEGAEAPAQQQEQQQQQQQPPQQPQQQQQQQEER